MSALRVNLHAHTWRCKHAQGDVVDYARAAATAGMEALGMSDHTPFPDGRWAAVRMELEQLDGYLAAFAPARAAVPGLPLFAGLECEPVDEYIEWFRQELLGRRELDYLICGCHWIADDDGAWRVIFHDLETPDLLARYAETLCRAMESGLFLFVAHPDAFGYGRQRWGVDCAAAARDICAVAARTGVPLELNGYGLRKVWIDTPCGRRPGYPWAPFWEEAARAGAPVVLSSDAHRPEDVAAGGAGLMDIVATYGLHVAEPHRRLMHRAAADG